MVRDGLGRRAMSAETWMTKMSAARRKGAPSGSTRAKAAPGPPAAQERGGGVGGPSEQGTVEDNKVRASGRTEEFKTIRRAMGSHGRVHRRG